MRFAVDTSVALYTVGRHSPYREACRRLVALLTESVIHGEASLALVPEYVAVRERGHGDHAKALEEAARWTQLVAMHPVERADVDRALLLSASVTGLGLPRALHAAACLNRSIPALISTDVHLDAVTELQRVDPRDAEQLLVTAHTGRAAVTPAWRLGHARG